MCVGWVMIMPLDGSVMPLDGSVCVCLCKKCANV